MTIGIVDDEMMEVLEEFHISLERTEGLNSRITLILDEGRVNIIDDDGK